MDPTDLWQVTIHGGTYYLTMFVSPETFGGAPAASWSAPLQLDAALFAPIAGSVGWAASDEENKPALQGVFLHRVGTALRAVATNGNQLALVEARPATTGEKLAASVAEALLRIESLAEAAAPEDPQYAATMREALSVLRTIGLDCDWTKDETKGRTEERRSCAETLGIWCCTRSPNHSGDHMAGTGERIAARWPQAPEPKP